MVTTGGRLGRATELVAHRGAVQVLGSEEVSGTSEVAPTFVRSDVAIGARLVDKNLDFNALEARAMSFSWQLPVFNSWKTLRSPLKEKSSAKEEMRISARI